MSKKIKTRILIVVGITVVFFIIFPLVLYIKLKNTSSLLSPDITTDVQRVENKINKITLDVNGTKYESEVVGTISVYDFMEKLQKEGKITFKDKTYVGMGKLIEEINGLKGEGNKYWIYYVNNTEAQVGVLDYKIKAGDVVSWKIETSSF